jgi:hypothetical protein
MSIGASAIFFIPDPDNKTVGYLISFALYTQATSNEGEAKLESKFLKLGRIRMLEIFPDETSRMACVSENAELYFALRGAVVTTRFKGCFCKKREVN